MLFLKSSFLLVFIFSITSCDSQNKHVTQAKEAVSQSIDSISQTVDQYTPDAVKSTARQVPEMAGEEYEKLFRVDYKVIELPRGKGAAQFEATLNELGKERWNCFHIEPQADKLIAFCSRRPPSYIRYIQSLIGFL